MGEYLDSFNSFYNTLSRNPSSLNLESFRNQIRICQSIISKTKSGIDTPCSNDTNEILVKICHELLSRLQISVEDINIDLHFLSSTALYSFINVLHKEHKRKMLENIYAILCEFCRKKEELVVEWKRQMNIKENISDTNEDLITMSLINGYFHTDLLNEEFMLQNMCSEFLKVSLHIVLKSCMIYSNNTLMAYKNLNKILKKVMELDVDDCISDDIRTALSYVILYNWENPLSAIKDINLEVFTSYINLLNDTVNEYLADVMDFPWSRAKYFTLCVLVPYLKSKNIKYSHIFKPMLRGLDYSLRNPSFVSPGSDLYKVLLQIVDHFNQWYDIFYEFFLDILIGNDHVAKTNLLNHWLPITIKKYPALLSIFINNFLEQPPTGKALYSFLFILKLARKSGQILASWNDKSHSVSLLKVHVKQALEHLNEDIRAQSFQIVCNSSKNNELPSIEEYRLIREFLIYNANYDSSSFRQNTLNCFTNFLVRVRDSYLHVIKLNEIKKCKMNLDAHKFGFEEFFKWLYRFIMENLHDSAANYQRKIISLEILDVILRYLFGGYLDKNIQFSLCRKSNQRHNGWKLVEHMKRRKKWLFEDKGCIQTLLKCIYYETNDIRQSAVNILTQYYLDNTYLLKQKNDLFINALIFCNSKKFYEVESGYIIFKLISKLNDCSNIRDINILINENEVSIDILDYLIDKATQQLIFQKEDILYSIYNNQPLHGLVSAINTFIINSNKVILCDTLKNLLTIMNDISNYFIDVLAVKSTSKQYPPSFAEMGASVEYIVESSKCEYASTSTNDPQLSDAHQLVLNNIWLNLKACCDLSSTLITSSCNSLNEDEVKKCLELNVSILTKCRHKGVIESAGVTLGQSVKYLTSLHKNSYNNFIGDVLEKYLLEATQEDKTGRSITRRSAGLTILVHRIVTNDSQDRKPLFYLAMNILLKILNVDNESEENLEAKKEEEPIAEELANEIDMPRATALHLLCRTVTESSLTSFVIQYASPLIIACFKHFSSEHWQIRNAALQLYGALVPKLIGQKSNSKVESIAESSMSYDELFSHIPGTWEYVVKSFRFSYNIKQPKEAFQTHSNLIPLLGLLSNMAKRYTLQQFGFYPTTNVIYVADVDELFRYLLSLLGSPIYTVRNLAAKTLKSLKSIDGFYEHWKYCKPLLNTENSVNGYLILVKYYVDYYSGLSKYMSESHVDSIMIKLDSILRDIAEYITDCSSYFSKYLHLQICSEISRNRIECNHIDSVSQALNNAIEMGTNINVASGIYCWLNEKIFYSIENCHDDSLCDVVKYLLDHFDFSIEGLLYALKCRFKRKLPTNSSILKQLILLFLNLSYENNKYLNKDVFDILFNLTLHAPIDVIKNFDNSTVQKFLSLLDTSDFFYNNGYLLPLCCLILSKKYILSPKQDSLQMVLEITDKTKKLSNCNVFNEEVRLMSAISIRYLTEITIHFIENNIQNGKFVYEVKSNILSTIFWLLQDEDISVRHESAKALFYAEKAATHPYSKLRSILTEPFVKMYFNNVSRLALKFLDMLLHEITLRNSIVGSNTSLQNPFDHNTKNVYWELKLVESIIKNLIPQIK